MCDGACRFRLSRQAGWRMPEGGRSVARPTLFGNPWIVGAPGRLDTLQVVYSIGRPLTPERAVEQYRAWLEGYAIPNSMLPGCLTRTGRRRLWDELAERRARVFEALEGLRGRPLGCWCELGAPCHADVLLEFANRPWPRAIRGAAAQ